MSEYSTWQCSSFNPGLQSSSLNNRPISNPYDSKEGENNDAEGAKEIIWDLFDGNHCELPTRIH